MIPKYQHAIVKWNGGRGALLCNRCRVIVAEGFDHEDIEHLCMVCRLARAGGRIALRIEDLTDEEIEAIGGDEIVRIQVTHALGGEMRHLGRIRLQRDTAGYLMDYENAGGRVSQHFIAAGLGNPWRLVAKAALRAEREEAKR
jgi:hypothetical protein